jgi:hypothetical protein
MISDSVANTILDVGVHVFAWYLALFAFYYQNVKKGQDGEKQAISMQTAGLLTAANETFPKTFELDKIEAFGNRLITDSKTAGTGNNNKKVMILHLSIIGAFLIILIGIYFWFSMGLGVSIHLKKIIIENVLVLIVMFGIESYFLMNVFPNFPLVKPTFANDTALDRLKSKLGQ